MSLVCTYIVPEFNETKLSTVIEYCICVIQEEGEISHPRVVIAFNTPSLISYLEEDIGVDVIVAKLHDDSMFNVN
jgi:hypothetical protein